MRESLRRAALLLTLIAIASSPAQAEPSYHLVGWTNTLIPGGGELLRGHPAYAVIQAGLEIGTFWWGYERSARTPLTLDGVPENLPPVIGRFGRHSGDTGTGKKYGYDISTPLYADWSQEFGLKYHMVNVYNAYRASAKGSGTIGNQKIDQSSTLSLFLSPLNPHDLAQPAVALGLLATAAALIYNYHQVVRTAGDLPATRPLSPNSNTLYGITYLGVFPTGSGAPEEMFYRGFLQHEMYSFAHTPFFSVPMSTTAYTFSHAPEDRLSAAVTGLFLGILTHANGGALGPSIAYHFWADVMAGFYQIALQRKSSGTKPLIDVSFPF